MSRGKYFPLAVPWSFVGRKVILLELPFDFSLLKYKSLMARGMAQQVKVPAAKPDRRSESDPWGPHGGEWTPSGCSPS